MGLTIKRFDDNDFFLSGYITTDDGSVYEMGKYKGIYSYFEFNVPIMKVQSLKVWYPSGCDFLFFYLNNEKDERRTLSTSPIPYIFRELFKIGYFNKLNGVGFFCGKRNKFPNYLEWNIKGFVIDIPICYYGNSAEIWLEVPFENIIEYDSDMLNHADLPEWFRDKYLRLGKKRKKFTDKQKLDLLMRLMPKDK